MSRITKHAIVCLCVVLATAVLIGLFKASKSLVDNSYSSESLLSTVNSKDIDSVNSIVYSNPEAEYSTAKVLYNSANLANRQRIYLGTDYEEWFPVIQVAMNNRNVYMSILESAGDPKECTVLYEGDLSSEDLATIGMVRVEESLSLVGMCDSTTLIFSYQRMNAEKPKIILLDASEMLFNTKRTALYSFGDSIPLCLRKGCFKVEDTLDYVIVYVKG